MATEQPELRRDAFATEGTISRLLCRDFRGPLLALSCHLQPTAISTAIGAQADKRARAVR